MGKQEMEMYSVILADDEPMILEGLTCLVPWETIGFEIKVKAYDGDELISVVKEYQPDVLITDIQMPFKTGLECIEEIKQISPDTIILILSGYATFEYAKIAMRYGVSGYLLKPVNQNELLEYLIRFKKELDSKERNIELKEKAFNDIFIGFFEGSSSLKSLDDIWHLFGLGVSPLSISIVLIKSSKQIEDDSLYSLIENICDKTDAGICIKYSSSIYAVIIYNQYYLDNDGKGTDDLINEIRASVFDTLELILSVVRSPIITPDRAIRSFNELKSIVFAESVKPDSMTLESIRKQILTALKMGDSSSIEELAVTLFPALSHMPRQEAGFECCSIVFMLRHEFYTSSIPDIFSSKSRYLSQSWWIEMKSVDEMIYWLRYIMGIVLSKVTEFNNNESVTETMINDICQYIQKNYMTITRSNVAEHFNINASYLSQSFKRLKGVSFIDYVTDVRIRNAKRLLATTNMKVQVVAEEVGYNSTQHFSKVFEKAEGDSPAEYRKKKQANKNTPFF